jgi:predicted O-methyltransferase YrrM
LKSIEQFIKELNIKTPPKEEFFQLSKKYPIIPEFSDYENTLNFERGILLYSLVAKYKFKNILEIGTAGGYSAMCMAKALHDNKIDGMIYTIDPVKPNINNNKIKILTGYFSEFRKSIPKCDFIFIDGAHNYEAVKNDFFSFIDIANDQYAILFDDYMVGIENHVKQAVDELIVPHLNYELFRTEIKKHYESLGKITEFDFLMCWVYDNKSLIALYPEKDEFLKKYAQRDKFQKIRKKIPVLRNHRIKFWK